MYNIILWYNLGIIYVDTYLCGNGFCFIFSVKNMLCIFGGGSVLVSDTTRAHGIYGLISEYVNIAVFA